MLPLTSCTVNFTQAVGSLHGAAAALPPALRQSRLITIVLLFLALSCHSPEWPDLLHPLASAVDTDLPTPHEQVRAVTAVASCCQL